MIGNREFTIESKYYVQRVIISIEFQIFNLILI